MEYFNRIFGKKTNVPIPEFFDILHDAIKHVESILELTAHEQMHACCRILNSVAKLMFALLKENWKEVFAEEYNLRKLIEDSFCNICVTENLIDL